MKAAAGLALLLLPWAVHAACPYMSTAHEAGVPTTAHPINAAASASYAAAVAGLDLEAVKQDIKQLLATSQPQWPADELDGRQYYGGLMVRLAWHCSGSYRWVRPVNSSEVEAGYRSGQGPAAAAAAAAVQPGGMQPLCTCMRREAQQCGKQQRQQQASHVTTYASYSSRATGGAAPVQLPHQVLGALWRSGLSTAATKGLLASHPAACLGVSGHCSADMM
jgi:hypothetical protein